MSIGKKILFLAIYIGHFNAIASEELTSLERSVNSLKKSFKEAEDRLSKAKKDQDQDLKNLTSYVIIYNGLSTIYQHSQGEAANTSSVYFWSLWAALCAYKKLIHYPSRVKICEEGSSG